MNDGAAAGRVRNAVPDVVPLVVDMDGTLFPGDLLHESALKLVRQQPLAVLKIPLWLFCGMAAVKNEIAQRVEIDAASLPYSENLLAWLREQKAVGRRLVLCTASNQLYASEVAAHLGLFDEVIASDPQTNVSARGKAEILVQRFGDQGFDYAGNSGDDMPVWARARQVIVVNARRRLAGVTRQRFNVIVEFGPRPASAQDWLRALRPRQWLKNLLALLFWAK